MNMAWFRSIPKYLIENDVPFKAFGDIESMTIEQFYRKYVNSDGDFSYRFANIGKYTIDVMLMIMFVTKDPDNLEAQWKVKQGKSTFRPRPD